MTFSTDSQGHWGANPTVSSSGPTMQWTSLVLSDCHYISSSPHCNKFGNMSNTLVDDYIPKKLMTFPFSLSCALCLKLISTYILYSGWLKLPENHWYHLQNISDLSEVRCLPKDTKKATPMKLMYQVQSGWFPPSLPTEHCGTWYAAWKQKWGFD